MPVEYEPFGAEWESEVMKMRKRDIVSLLRQACTNESKFTANNSESVKLPSETLMLLRCSFFDSCPCEGKNHAGCYSEAPCFKR